MEGPMFPDFRAADGREIMMHPRSEFPQLAVPGVGYLQNLSIERDLIGRVRTLRSSAEDRDRFATIDYLAAAFVVIAVTFGPLIVSLI
jgi:hypothetical protein